jgi:hypothetical protein
MISINLSTITGVARLFYSRAIFNHFSCSGGRKFIPGGRRVQKFLKMKIPRGSKNVLQKCIFLAFKVKIFFKNGIFGGLFYKNFEPPSAQGPQKKFGGPHFGHVCTIIII